MTESSFSPTIYPDINEVLSQLLLNVQSVLGKHFLGLYIYGSLASGDFNPHRSDIDFLVATKDVLPEPIIDELVSLHRKIYSRGSPWATKLEGSYIPQKALRRYDPERAHFPSLRVDGSFDIDHHGKDWMIQCHLIREQSLVLAGPNPSDLIDPISSKELKEAALATLEDWWSPQIENPTRLQIEEYRAYSILTMCRILYTLHHGTVASKSEAVVWSKKYLDKNWTQIIENAHRWPQNSELIDTLTTQSLIRFTVQEAKQFELRTRDHYSD